MRPITHIAVAAMVAASLIATSTALADDSAAPAAQPAPAQAKISKSRSNIQNNREAPAGKDDAAATDTDEPAELLKTKTKSNQSND